jgi:4-amino-4-deoxy-L-arabinose transferase-like glycosyltransferase
MSKNSIKLVSSPVFYQVLPFLVVFSLLRLVFWGGSFPNPDEAYYWLWGQHLDWSYYDHPPLQAWIQGLFTATFGRSTWVLRLPNLLSNAVLLFTYWRINHYLYGEHSRHSWWLLVSLLLSSPLYFFFMALGWHDHLLITCCLVAGYLLARFLDGYVQNNRGESWRLYGVGVALGIASLCKYSAVFIDLSFFLLIATHPKLRLLLNDRRFHITLGIIVVALLPIVFWNILNNFQSFQYYIDRSFGDVAVNSIWRFQPLQLINFLLFSCVFLSPMHCWTIFQICRSRDVLKFSTFYSHLAAWTFAVPTLLLMAIALSSMAYYYWNIIAYLMLLALLPIAHLKMSRSVSVDNNKTIPIRQHALFWSGQVYGLLFAILIVIHTTLMPLSVLVTDDVNTDPDSRMLFGWPEVATAVTTTAAEFDARPLLLTTDYRSASALAYQLNNPDVLAISPRNDQFDIWYARRSQQGNLQGQNAVLLYDEWHPLDEALRSQFHQLSDPYSIPVIHYGKLIKTYYLVKAYDFQA